MAFSLFVLLLLVVVGGFAVAVAVFRGSDQPTGRCASMRSRRVTCAGTVQCAQPLQSPASAQPVLAWRIEVHATFREKGRLVTRIVHEESQIAQFVLDDGSGPVPVAPAEHDILMPWQVAVDEAHAVTLAGSVTGRPERFGPAEYAVLPDVVPGGADRLRVVERVVMVPVLAVVSARASGGRLAASRDMPLMVEPQRASVPAFVGRVLLPRMGQAVLRAVRRLRGGRRR